jgi:glycosyltransferase involved in cell wall biosynthesis
VPVLVIPNGVDLEKFKAVERQWEPARLLFVGRVVYQKGLDLLLKALSELRDLEWTLDIVGDGPRVERLRTQASELQLSERVNFPGWQSRQMLPNTYNQSNLFVYPSRHEGMPNAVLEAMASGLPVLATRIAGNEELVSAETGLLVPAEDSNALKTALTQLVPNSNLRASMGAAARKRVEQQFSWANIAEAYLDLMKNIVEKR